MGLFRRTIIEPTKEKILDKEEFQTTTEPEEPEEPEETDDVTICMECKYHKYEDGDHRCYAQATKTKNYITGQEGWEDVDDCENINEDGDCSDFKRL